MVRHFFEYTSLQCQNQNLVTGPWCLSNSNSSRNTNVFSHPIASENYWRLEMWTSEGTILKINTKLSGSWGVLIEGCNVWSYLGHHSGNFPVGVEETVADFHNGGVPKADWKKRAMSGSDKPQLFVCTLLESHANEKKTSWQDTLIWSQSLSCEVDNPKERFTHTLFL